MSAPELPCDVARCMPSLPCAQVQRCARARIWPSDDDRTPWIDASPALPRSDAGGLVGCSLFLDVRGVTLLAGSAV